MINPQWLELPMDVRDIEFQFCDVIRKYKLSRDMTKPTKSLCAQQRLRSAWSSAQSDQSSLSAWRNIESLATHWAHSDDSDHTWRMPRLIWVSSQFVGFVMLQLINEVAQKRLQSSRGIERRTDEEQQRQYIAYIKAVQLQ